MTTSYLGLDIEADEGCVLTAYPDPLTNAAPWTIGVGHTGSEVHPGLIWTMDQAKSALDDDISKTVTGLTTAIPWWTKVSDIRQDALVNMAFNIGVAGLLKFRLMLAAVQSGDWETASAEMLASGWAQQVERRAKRLAQQMLSGERA